MVAKGYSEKGSSDRSLDLVHGEDRCNETERDRLLKKGVRSSTLVEFVVEIGAMCVMLIAEAPEERRSED